MNPPDVEAQAPSIDATKKHDSRNVQDEQQVSSRRSESLSPPVETKKPNSSDGSINAPAKPDNRPRHARTGEPLSLPREIVIVTVICLAQLMTQAGVGQGKTSLGPLNVLP